MALALGAVLASFGSVARGMAPQSRAENVGSIEARLVRAPLDKVGLRQLAQIARDKGAPRAAHLFATLGGRLGWRDSQTQFLLLSDAVSDHDLATAMLHLDALLRREAGQTALLFDMLHLAAHEPAGRKALIARLRLRPPWRRAFFQDLDRLDASDIAAHDLLMEALLRQRDVDLRGEIVPLVDRLVRIGDIARARALWIAAAGIAPAPLLDGKFALLGARPASSRVAPFEWRLGIVPEVELFQPDDVPGTAPSALQLRAAGPAFGTLLSQVTTLAPGRYRLSVVASDPGPLLKGDLVWDVACAGAGRRLVMTGQVGAASPARRVAWTFEVPKGDCPLQTLSLQIRRMAGGGPIDVQIQSVRIDATGPVDVAGGAA